MKIRLLKKVRKRYKIVKSIAKHGHICCYYNAIDTKNKWKSIDCLTLSAVEDILIWRISKDYPNSMKRNRVKEVWF